MVDLLGANRSTSQSGSLPRKMFVVLQAGLSLALLSASGLLATALRNLASQNFGFEHDRRTIVTIDPKRAGYRGEQLTALYQRIYNSLPSLSGHGVSGQCSYRLKAATVGMTASLSTDIRRPDPGDDSSSGFDRVTGGTSARPRGIWQSLTRHLPGSFSNRKIQLENILGVPKPAPPANIKS